MPSKFTRLSWSLLDLAQWATTKKLEKSRFLGKMEQPLHFKSQGAIFWILMCDTNQEGKCVQFSGRNHHLFRSIPKFSSFKGQQISVLLLAEVTQIHRLWSLLSMKKACLHKQENNWMCEKFILALQSSAHVSKTQLAVMSTMIIDSLQHIKLREEKSLCMNFNALPVH